MNLFGAKQHDNYGQCLVEDGGVMNGLLQKVDEHLLLHKVAQHRILAVFDSSLDFRHERHEENLLELFFQRYFIVFYLLVLFLILFDFLELFEDRKLFFGLGKKRNGGPKPLLTQVMPDSLVDLAGLGTFPQFVLVK